MIRVIWKFLQPGLISSMRFEEELGHTKLSLERISLHILDLLCNAWKHILGNETFQKLLFKIFSYNKQVTRKIKYFQKRSNKEIYFTLQSNNTKYIKPFMFIL